MKKKKNTWVNKNIWTKFERGRQITLEEAQKSCADSIAKLAPPNTSEEEIKRAIDESVIALMNDEVWINNRYQVNITRPDPSRKQNAETGGFIHLSIKSIDRKPVHDWRDFQRIKNELVGEEHEAVELYPAESRLVDTANQYHLWCIVNVGVRFPLGWVNREVTSESIAGGIQRPITETN